MTHVFDLGHEDIDGLVGLNFVQPRTFTMFMVGANRMPGNTIGMILGPSGSGPNNQLRRDSSTTALLVGTSNQMPATTVNMGDTRAYHLMVVRDDGSLLRVDRGFELVSSTSFTATSTWDLSQIGAWCSSLLPRRTAELARLSVERLTPAAPRPAK